MAGGLGHGGVNLAPGGARKDQFRIYLITDRRLFGGDTEALTHAITVALAAAPERLVGVQLRERDLPGREYAALAARLRDVTAARGALLFISDRVDVALACGADGVHLPGGGFALEDVRALAPQLRIGVSTHTREEVLRARDDGADLVVLGPIHAPQSKASARPALGESALMELDAGPSLRVFALGGIDARNAAYSIGAGAHGVACVSAVLGARSPAVAMKALVHSVAMGASGGRRVGPP